MARSRKEIIAILVSAFVVLAIISYPIIDRIAMSPEKVFARKGGLQIVLAVADETLSESQLDKAINESVDIISERLKQFGVFRPVVTRDGREYILIQMPGLKAPERESSLILQTAMLEFRMVCEEPLIARTIEDLDLALKPFISEYAATNVDSGDIGTLDRAVIDDLSADKPFSSCLYTFSGGGVLVEERFIEIVDMLLKTPQAESAVSPQSEFLWSRHTMAVNEEAVGNYLYLVDKTAHLTGSKIEDAETRKDPDHPGQSAVSISFNDEGRRTLSGLTGSHIGEQLAIVLDRKVLMAPVIQTKVPNGECMITGTFSDLEARDMTMMLRAGALPVSLKIISEEVIEPGN